VVVFQFSFPGSLSPNQQNSLIATFCEQMQNTRALQAMEWLVHGGSLSRYLADPTGRDRFSLSANVRNDGSTDGYILVIRKKLNGLSIEANHRYRLSM
jgi:hypothetical protein